MYYCGFLLHNDGGIYDTLVWNEEGISGTVLGLLDILLVNYDFHFYFLLILNLYFRLCEEDLYEMLNYEILDILAKL